MPGVKDAAFSVASFTPRLPSAPILLPLGDESPHCLAGIGFGLLADRVKTCSNRWIWFSVSFMWERKADFRAELRAALAIFGRALVSHYSAS